MEIMKTDQEIFDVLMFLWNYPSVPPRISFHTMYSVRAEMHFITVNMLLFYLIFCNLFNGIDNYLFTRIRKLLPFGT